MTRLAKNPAALTFSAVAANLCRAAGCASLTALALALAPLSAAAAPAGQSSVAPENPAANVVANPNYDDCSANGLCSEGRPCYTANYAPAFSSPEWEQDELQAIDNARAKEGLGPMYLPSGFNSLSGPEQLLVVIDLERVARGLAFAGILPRPTASRRRAPR